MGGMDGTNSGHDMILDIVHYSSKWFGLLRWWYVDATPQVARFYRRHHASLANILQVVGQIVHHPFTISLTHSAMRLGYDCDQLLLLPSKCVGGYRLKSSTFIGQSGGHDRGGSLAPMMPLQMAALIEVSESCGRNGDGDVDEVSALFWWCKLVALFSPNKLAPLAPFSLLLKYEDSWWMILP